MATGTVSRACTLSLTMLTIRRLLLGSLPARHGPIHVEVSSEQLSVSSRFTTWLMQKPENAAPSAGKAMPGDPTEDELDAGAEKDFQAVLRHGPDVTVRCLIDPRACGIC